MRTPRAVVLAALSFLAEPLHAQDAVIDLCLARAADSSPVYPTKVFPAGTKETVATFRVPKGAYKKLEAAWIAVDVPKQPAPDFKFGSVVAPLQGHDRGSMRMDFPKAMPPGKYRLEVTADGKPFKSIDFSVADKEPAIKASGDDLLPLAAGKTWTYSFVQESGKLTKISFPDLKPGADGKYRATVTMKVAGTDAKGTHIEMRRNDRLVFEEWWRVDKQGFLVTQRKSGDEVAELVPPQVLWKLPLRAPAKWSYRPKDKSYEQKYSMWGPVPVKAPGGDTPGFVVLVEQGNTTVERHFVPGIGLVREVIIVALGDEMASRQEMVLQK